MTAGKANLGGGPLAARAAELVLAAAATSGADPANTSSIECAHLLAAIDADDATIAAALIAGSLPRGSLDVKAITSNFGAEVLELVTGAYRAGRLESLQGKAQSSNPAAQVEMLRKMLLALADDVRVVLIKLAERVVLMRSLTRATEAERVAAGQLTRDVFAPLANRLGVFPIKWELEDLSFRFLEPEVYKRIAGFLDGKRSEREEYIEAVIGELRGALSSLGIEAQ
ncbi:MAG TPA: HD domain-containing protein, partial [Usitatibacteraceae bacterium]|nr:HD domain-containing protein [Usitatibacteraceae bacterium]